MKFIVFYDYLYFVVISYLKFDVGVKCMNYILIA